MWYVLQTETKAIDGTLQAKVRVPAESAWFDGHFPGYPVLPGIAQLGMVLDLIRSAMLPSASVTEVSRVRFKQMILPEERLKVMVEARPVRQGTFDFRITRQDKVVCSGTMTIN